MTTTIELIEIATVLAKMHQGQMNDDLREIAQRLRELDEQVKQQINDYGRGMAAADLALNPDCVKLEIIGSCVWAHFRVGNGYAFSLNLNTDDMAEPFVKEYIASVKEST